MVGADFLEVVTAITAMSGYSGCLGKAGTEKTFESGTAYFCFGFFMHGALVIVEEEVLFFGKGVWFEGYRKIMCRRNERFGG